VRGRAVRAADRGAAAGDVCRGGPAGRHGGLPGGTGSRLGEAEAAIRVGVLKLGCGLLEKLLAADGGHRGPRVPRGQGYETEFVAYQDKVTSVSR
jgi:hypothetical protein